MLDSLAKSLDSFAKNLDSFAKGHIERRIQTGASGVAMSDVAMASAYLRAAFPKEKHGTVQAACWAAYRALKLTSERRARALWNNEARRIDAHEMQIIKQAALAHFLAERAHALACIEELESSLAGAAADVCGRSAAQAGAADRYGAGGL